MQIFKCIRRHCETSNSGSDKKFTPKQTRSISQNLLEFIFVLPMLIFISLAILEVALYWQDVNTIYNLNAEINANLALLDYTGKKMGEACIAVDNSRDSTGAYVQPHSALATLERTSKMITMTDTPTFNVALIDPPNTSAQPFSLYKVTGGPIITPDPINGVAQPATNQIVLWVDCRNPFEDGVTTQLEFYHKTIVMHASIPRFDKPEPIVIIPDKIFIASPKLNTLRHY